MIVIQGLAVLSSCNRVLVMLSGVGKRFARGRGRGGLWHFDHEQPAGACSNAGECRCGHRQQRRVTRIWARDADPGQPKDRCISAAIGMLRIYTTVY